MPLANGAQRTLATDLLDVSVGQTEHIGTTGPVPSGATASVTWEGLASASEYTWFARATDPSGNVVDAPPYVFTTAAAEPGGETPGGEEPGGEEPGGEEPGGETPGEAPAEESPGSTNAGPTGDGRPDSGKDESLAVTGAGGAVGLIGAALLVLAGLSVVLCGRRGMREA